jgi:peptidyl-prolyl cis-trans isomerase D
MLESMRNATQGLVGRAIMTVILGLIIVSFVIWGIGSDMLRSFSSDKVATVGSTAISTQAFRDAYQNTLQQYQRQLKTPLTNSQAHAMGIDSQVLSRLISDAALDEKARALGLAISDETISAAVLADPRLQDKSGKFDRSLFEQALRDSGQSERGFVALQRQTYLRQQIGYSLAAGIAAPKALVEALAHVDSQARSLDFFVLPPAAAGEIAAPGDEALKTFFEARKASFRAPEFRDFNMLAITPTTIAKPGEVSDADAMAQYEKVKDTRFGSPEKRKLQQIVFPNETDAAQASAKIKAGASFDDIAKEQKLSDTETDLGTVARKDVFDKAIAEAAFALPSGGVSDVIKGQFGPVIVRVGEITPASLKPFTEVADIVKKEIAVDRAAKDVLALHDKIEDARVSGKSLDEAAKSVGLSARTIAGADQRGFDRTGAPIADIPEKDALLRAVFASDVGVDNEAVATKDRGFVWFDVAKIEPARDRTLDEVRDKVAAEWRADQIAKALAEKAADLVKQLNSGADIAALAAAAGTEVRKAADVRRQGGANLPETLVTAVFNTGAAGAGSAATPDGRAVFKVTGDVTPPLDPLDPKGKDLQNKTSSGFADDFVGQYVGALQRELGVKIDDTVLRSAQGG